ncbi:MAG: GldG family protein, partial [Oscillospiraceae bacterium]|nr:GldG family protein [Oscillospiraceae bacterium]
MKGIIQDKRVRYGGYSVLMTLVAIAILIIINLVAAQLDLKWDMSANKIYSISDDTRNILDGLEADVTIYAMFPTGSANILFKEIIEQYPSRSGRVKLEYRDPVLYPTFLSQYSADIPEYSLLVVSGDRFRIINSNDFIKYEFDYSTWQQYPVAIEIEPLLTGAIRAVCDPDSPVVYRLIGHDESELPPAITEQFSREGYELRDINLILEGVIPDDCDAVIISTPRWDITPDEAKALSGYLMAGGAAALLINPSGVETPNLYDLAAEYGLGFSRSLLVE